MIPYFENINNWNAYHKELLEWIDTPYRHMTNIKGRGADCTLFIAATLKNAGILTEIYFKDYPKDWHLHQNQSIVVDSYTEGAKHLLPGLSMETFEDLPKQFIHGDIILMSIMSSEVIHHAGIYIDQKTMIHCIQPRGVQLVSFEGWWQRHIKKTVRIMEDKT